MTKSPDTSDLNPSKSQRKRDMKEIQEIGKQLAEIPEYLLEKINMDSELTNAVILARRLENNKSNARLFRFIGKLLSQMDLTEIKHFIDTYNLQKQTSNTAFHNLEKWRDRLVKDGDSVLDELLVEFPDLDRQHLRQLIRNAQKEELQQKPPASSRAIFRYLKDNT